MCNTAGDRLLPGTSPVVKILHPDPTMAEKLKYALYLLGTQQRCNVMSLDGWFSYQIKHSKPPFCTLIGDNKLKNIAITPYTKKNNYELLYI